MEVNEVMKKAISQKVGLKLSEPEYTIIGQSEIERKDGQGKFYLLSVLSQKTGLVLEFFEREILDFDVANCTVTVQKQAIAKAQERAEKRAALRV